MAEDRKKTDMLEKLAEGWNYPDESDDETASLKDRIRQRVVADRQREIGAKAMRRRLLFESGESSPEPSGGAPKAVFPAIRDDGAEPEAGASESGPEDSKQENAGEPGRVKSVLNSQNLIFKIYGAKDPSAAFFETDRGDAFDGCFTDPSAESGNGTPVTPEDTLNELLSGIGDKVFASYDDEDESEKTPEPEEEEVPVEPEVPEEPFEAEAPDLPEEPAAPEPEIYVFPKADGDDLSDEFEDVSFFEYAETVDEDEMGSFEETAERIRKALANETAEEEPAEENGDSAEEDSSEEFEEFEDFDVKELEVETKEPEPEQEPEPEPEIPDEEPPEAEVPENRELKPGNAARRALFDLDIGSIYMNEISSGANDEKKMSSRDMHALAELVRHDEENDRFTATGNTAECNETARRLKKALDELGVEAAVQKVSAGPSVITVTVKTENAAAVKDSEFAANVGSKIGSEVRVNLAALSGTVSFEISRGTPQRLYVYDILRSREFIGGNAAIPVPLGLDTSGNAIVTDLKTVSHLLMAGERQTGKSTALKAIVIGVLCGTLPRDVKLMIFDPVGNMPESCGGIPHLIMPVEKNPERCVEALKWAVNEMSGRLELLQNEDKTDIDGFNAAKRGRGSFKKLPRLVIVIDEFAELMSLPKANVERLLLPLVQKGGHAGVHVVLSTGKLSVEAVTGLIKANVGTRIAFKVSSRVQSRIIIDGGGAEKLLGNGDMLLCANFMPGAVRIQGAFVSDEDIEKAANAAKNLFGSAEYDSELMGIMKGGEEEPEDREEKEMGTGTEPLDAAREREMIIEAARYAFERPDLFSVSVLQRLMRIGYNRACMIIEKLEKMGLVSGVGKPGEGRRLLMTEEEWQDRLAEEEPFDD